MEHELCFTNLSEAFEEASKKVNKGELLDILVILKGFP